MSSGAKIVVTVALTVLTVFALAGHSRLSGPVLWHIGDHGVHRHDFLVLALWAVTLVLLWRKN